MNTEAEVFEALRNLCRKPGFSHAIASLCFKSNVVAFKGTLTTDDMLSLYSHSRLLRTEISVLIALMVQSAWTVELPSPDALKSYIDEAEKLLAALHHMMKEPMLRSISSAANGSNGQTEPTKGEVLREAIFYGPESAYPFQYRDFSPIRYANDREWLAANLGFDMNQARSVAGSFATLHDRKLSEVLGKTRDRRSADQTLLSAYTFGVDEIAAVSGIDKDIVSDVLAAFTFTGDNGDFQSASDRSATNERPLLRLQNGDIILFEPTSLVESMYESPYTWMRKDSGYRTMASHNRGEFTEDFSHNRLRRVFGNRTHKNIHLFAGKDEIGEIDVLVLFGDRLIVLQAKSRRLPTGARKGNDEKIESSFQYAVQEAYDQALSCATHIAAADCRIVDDDGKEIVVSGAPKKIYIFCVVADHYPALAFQARQFLKFQTTDVVQAPFVMDVFLLDAMTEILESPLRLLDYVARRIMCIDQLMLCHELTALSFHLKGQLWINNEFQMVMLGDDISVDLDVAMAVRRDGIPGERTPKGILTEFSGTPFGRLVEQLENSTDAPAIELGLMLLSMSGASCEYVSKGISAIAAMTRRNRALHDFTIAAGTHGEGITFHSNLAPDDEAQERLLGHCYVKKYAQKSRRWFGVCIDDSSNLRFAVYVDFPFEQTDEFDAMMKNFPQKQPTTIAAVLTDARKVPKIGRNDPCPCGSGLKYKKCCLGRS